MDTDKDGRELPEGIVHIPAHVDAVAPGSVAQIALHHYDAVRVVEFIYTGPRRVFRVVDVVLNGMCLCSGPMADIWGLCEGGEDCMRPLDRRVDWGVPQPTTPLLMSVLNCSRVTHAFDGALVCRKLDSEELEHHHYPWRRQARLR